MPIFVSPRPNPPFTLPKSGGTAFGLGDRDNINGNASEDIISGGRGNDTLTGGAGSDQIFGGDGTDTIKGGTGDDFISGHRGIRMVLPTFFSEEDGDVDQLYGGSGNDRIIIGKGDQARGETGMDTLQIGIHGFAATAPVYNLDFSDIDSATLKGFGWGTTKVSGFERVDLTISQLGANSTITGSGGHDTFKVQGVSSFVNGVFVPGLVRVLAGAGNDILIGSTIGNDNLNGGAGDDYINGGLGVDKLTGGSGFDIFYQKIQGVDPLGGGGTQPDDIVDFNAKQDIFFLVVPGLELTSAALTFDHFEYEKGSGKLFYDEDLSGPKSGVHVATFKNKPNLTAANFAFDNMQAIPEFMDGTPYSAGKIVSQRGGGSGKDTFTGSNGRENFFGNSGNDKLVGNGGDDLLMGGRGTDTISGGTGRDRIVGGDGADRLTGGDGNDVIVSGTAATGFSSSGDNDADVIDGGKGNDWITIDSRDTAVGGAGSDTLVYSYFESDTTSPAPVALDFSGVGGAASSFGVQGIKAGGFEQVDVRASGAPATKITGSSGDDILRLDVYNPGGGPLTGGPGRAGGTVNGGAGDDKIWGSGYSDKLNGGAGDDQILLQANDVVNGGSGSDTFVYASINKNTGNQSFAQINQLEDKDIILVQFDSGFTGETVTLANQQFIAGVNPQATSSNLAQFLYFTTTGVLQLDINGQEFGGVIDIARVSGLSATQVVAEYMIA